MTNPRHPQQPQPYGYNQGGYPAPAPKARRRVWPWVLLVVVMLPILGFIGCTALVGGAISAVDQARKGGTVQIGETFTYASGLALTVAAPKPYQPKNEFEVGRDEQAFEAAVTVTNGSDRAVSATLLSKNATVNGTPAQEVLGTGTFATQDIAPGQQLVLPFRFKVAEGTTGPLQIAVTDSFNEPVFFTGQLG
jgi:hypothetical protein